MLNDAVLFDRFSSHVYNMYVAGSDVGTELSNGFWNSVPCVECTYARRTDLLRSLLEITPH